MRFRKHLGNAERQQDDDYTGEPKVQPRAASFFCFEMFHPIRLLTNVRDDCDARRVDLRYLREI